MTDSMPDEPSTTVALVNGVALTGLDLALKRLKCEPEEVFRRCGITPSDVGRHDRQIALTHYLRVYEFIQSEFGQGDFGVQFGAITRPKNAGLLGFLALTAPTLEQAIVDFRQFLPLLLQGFHVDIHRLSTKQWKLSFSLVDGQSAAAPQVNEQGLAWFSNIIRAVLGQRHWLPEQLHLQHERPAHRALLERIFGPQIHYGQPANALIIKDSDLQRRNLRADALLYRTLHHQAQLNLDQSQHQPPWLEFVEFTLEQLIVANTPTLEALASQLQISPRKLQARLKARDTHFSRLVTQVRLRLASSLLSRGQVSVSEIALTLGYSETAAFTHAFKRQTGQSPREFRRSHQALSL